MDRTHQGSNNNGISLGSNTARIQRLLLEDIDALYLSKELETLETSGLVIGGRDFTGLDTGTKERRGFRAVVGLDEGGSGEGARSGSRAGGLQDSSRGGAGDDVEHDGSEVRVMVTRHMHFIPATPTPSLDRVSHFDPARPRLIKRILADL